MSKLVSLILTAVMFLFPSLNISKIEVNTADWETDYDYVFCHGLNGWGSYDFQNNFLPYWGMFGGDMTKNLNKLGFSCYSASKSLDKNDIQPGIWNVAETYRGDHMALNGDLFKPNNIRTLYSDWMDMINSI